jgi:hypothetical protein
VLCDLILGNQLGSAGSGGSVELRIDLATLAGCDDNPGLIPGMGPVLADVARQTALALHDSTWTFRVVDDAGRVVSTGATRRRPDTATARTIRAQHQTCVFPGCRMPASACDLDHNDPWAQGGPTVVENMTPKCRHDHRLKDHGWTHQQTDDGENIWTSPLGHTYITQGQSP